MDKAKSPEITLEGLELVECNVGGVRADIEPNFHLALTGLERALSSDGKVLSYRIGFDLMKGIAKPACTFTCTFLVTYSRSSGSNMAWDDFKHYHAVAHVIPYLREFVSNMTARMPLPKLILPPVNVHILLREYSEPQLKEKVAAPAAT